MIARQLMYELLQIAALLAWLPFRAICHGTYWIARASEWLGNHCGRALYYGIVQAKRRALGWPLWQEHDWQIGIARPCEHCGVSVPPGRHRADCRFFATIPSIPSGSYLTREQIAAFANLHRDQFRRDTPPGETAMCSYCGTPTSMCAYTDLESNESWPACCARPECLDRWSPKDPA